MAELVWTEESERWLKDIFDYIALDNPDAAASVVVGIYDRAQSLLQFPESGYKYEGSARSMSVFDRRQKFNIPLRLPVANLDFSNSEAVFSLS